MQNCPLLKRRILRIFVRYVVQNPGVLEQDSIEKIYQTIYNETIAKCITGIPKYICFPNISEASTGRIIGDLSIFSSNYLEGDWEEMYTQIMDPKYAKGIHKFSTKITGKPILEDIKAPIFLVGRERVKVI